jgi:hypothetical protein
MKRMITMVVVMLCVTAAAQAATSVYAEITYPTTTTWRLYLQEVDWTGSTAGMTASGFGIASFAIDVSGVTSASKATPVATNLLDDQDPPAVVGQIGFPNGPGAASVTAGVAQAFAGQDTTVPAVLVYGFGVSAGTFATPAGYTGSYSWLAPGAPGTAAPGVLAFSGKREAGNTVSIVWGDRAKANVFKASTEVATMTVDVVPEPATAMVLLLGLGLLRRRR